MLPYSPAPQWLAAAARRLRVWAAFLAEAERSANERAAEAAPPLWPPVFAGAVLLFLPRPEPLCLPPPSFCSQWPRRAAPPRLPGRRAVHSPLRYAQPGVSVCPYRLICPHVASRPPLPSMSPCTRPCFRPVSAAGQAACSPAWLGCGEALHGKTACSERLSSKKNAIPLSSARRRQTRGAPRRRRVRSMDMLSSAASRSVLDGLHPTTRRASPLVRAQVARIGCRGRRLPRGPRSATHV